jgi:hypothetical protein
MRSQSVGAGVAAAAAKWWYVVRGGLYKPLFLGRCFFTPLAPLAVVVVGVFDANVLHGCSGSGFFGILGCVLFKKKLKSFLFSLTP